MLKIKLRSYILFFGSLIFYVFLAYSIQRHETLLLVSAYTSLFLMYALVLNRASITDVRFWIIASIIFRCVFLFSVPQLSDDVYRFIWDGKLLANGFSPYSLLPSHLIEMQVPLERVHPGLFELLNSKEYYSIYPPLAQIFFWISVVVSPDSLIGSIVILRVLVLAAELGSLWLILQLLKLWRIDEKNVLIYSLNPLVILELVGNLHFEAFVIFFLLLCIYWLIKNGGAKAGLSMSLAVGAKLLPVIFLPSFLMRLNWKRSIFFYGACLIGLIILFLPFYSQLGFDGYSESFKLYFKKFEFNASIYYLVREYGYWQKGFNIIESAGWKLGIISAVIIHIISWWPLKFSSFQKLEWKNFPQSLNTVPEVVMWVLFTYLAFATTVHPWYILPVLAFSTFTKYRFAVIWSFLIFFTYAGYTTTGFRENLWIVGAEYSIMFGYLIYEWWRYRRSFTNDEQ